MHIDLNDKKILVTGVSRGIGKAIALQLGKSGARVGVHFNNNQKNALDIIAQIGNNSQPFQANLADMAAVEQLFKEVTHAFHGVDVLINNAGIAINSPISKNNTAWIQDWNLTMQVNLSAAALLCKLAIAQFKKNGGGIIINISSRAAFRGDTADFMAYAASKGGMVSLTRSIARAYGKDNIKAFTIAPGFIKTDMAQDFIEEYGEDYVKNDLALNELTQPHHLAPLITLLASGMLDHATGGTFDVNAGSYVH